jgi:RNA polymerase sigma-70 factor, ECF subfamily
MFAVKDPELALDIVQDAMLKLVEKYRAHSPEEWAPLFYRVLENRIQDQHRRRSVLERVLVYLGFDAEADTPPLDAFPAPAEAQPEVVLSDRQTHATLLAAIKALPLRQQQVVLLREWEGLDVRDTARAMGCSAGSVKTHYSRAVQALRQKLRGKIHVE